MVSKTVVQFSPYHRRVSVGVHDWADEYIALGVVRYSDGTIEPLVLTEDGPVGVSTLTSGPWYLEFE